MRLLSWNIQWGRGIDGRVDLDRTAAVIRTGDADIICLQEVAVNHPGLPAGVSGPLGMNSSKSIINMTIAIISIVDVDQ